MMMLHSLSLFLLPLGAFAANFTVNVGKDGSTIEPSFVRAEVGDNVFFDFYSGNHTITSSSFENPCVYSHGNDELVGQYGSIDYGPTPSDIIQTRYIMRVESARPAWYHCAQTCDANHCKNGMVFALNPTDDQPFDQFLENARNSDDPPPDDCAWTASRPMPTRTSTSTSEATTNTITRQPTPSATSASAGNAGGNDALSRAQFAFAGGPSVAVLAVVALLMF